MSAEPKRPDCESCAIGEDLLRHNLAAAVQPPSETPDPPCAFCGSSKHVLAACMLNGAEAYRREFAAVAPPSAPPGNASVKAEPIRGTATATGGPTEMVNGVLQSVVAPPETAPTPPRAHHALTTLVLIAERYKLTPARRAFLDECIAVVRSEFMGETTPLTAHPEAVCERCGRENVTWFAPSDLWNRAARTPDGDPMLCPVCFIKAAESIGIGTASAWKVAPEIPAPSMGTAPETTVPTVTNAWQHCTPAMLNSGVDCSTAMRRPCSCVNGLGIGHDHLVPVSPVASSATPTSEPTPGPTCTLCHGRKKVTLLNGSIVTCECEADSLRAALASSQQEVERFTKAVTTYLRLKDELAAQIGKTSPFDRDITADILDGCKREDAALRTLTTE